MYFKIIFDKELWNQASETERLEVVNFLMENKLKNLFEFQGFKEFSCKDLKNVIAVFKHLETNMNFHLIPGGNFFFGAGKNLAYIKKHYSIDISENFNELVNITPFLMSSYLITEFAWNKFNGKKLHFNFGENHPIDGVDRDDVTNWANKIGARLPSDTEWEYACKAGSETIFYWGNKPDLEMAWTEENTPFSDEYINLTETEQKPPNAFGLVGMIGNLGEWVADDEFDEYDREVPFQSIFKSDYSRANGILRGGWNNYNWNFNRSTSRISCSPDSGDTGCSARIVFDKLFN